MKWWEFRGRFVLLLVATIFFTLTTLPALDPWDQRGERARRTSAMNDIVQIVNAVRNFTVDYGRPPLVKEDGFCETGRSNAALIRVLTGSDQRINPRGVRYLEVPIRTATPSKPVRSGVNADNGIWMDPWGNPYRVRIATGEAHIRNPYSEDVPTFIKSEAIAWSVGKDGVQGRKDNPLTKNGSGDVVSWE